MSKSIPQLVSGAPAGTFADADEIEISQSGISKGGILSQLWTYVVAKITANASAVRAALGLGTSSTKNTGTSIADPGTGALEALLPIQTVAGASHVFVAADLFMETRRSNAGSAMTDTFPAAATAGMVNGTRIRLNNVDASASLTVSAGAGTTLSGSGVIGHGRSTQWVYDAPGTVWRTSMNSLTTLLSANNLSEVASVATARTNLGLAAIAASGSGADLTSNSVTNAQAAQMAAHTIKGNSTGSTANAADLTVAQLAALFTLPTRQAFATGSGIYTTPANCTWIEVEGVGGGGGGAGSGTSPGAATGGGTTTFGTSLLTGPGGAAGTTNGTTSSGGTPSGGDVNIIGNAGQKAATLATMYGGFGGSTPLGGGAPPGVPGGGSGAGAVAPGTGGGGAGSGSTVNAGGGGAGGGYFRKLITGPLATYAYAIGVGGTGGTLGTSGAAGGNGAAGIVIVTEHYS